jgi:hypothetical protein
MSAASQLPESRRVDRHVSAAAGVGAWGAASADFGVPMGGTSATTRPAAAAAAAFGCVDWYQYPAQATPANLPY